MKTSSFVAVFLLTMLAPGQAQAQTWHTRYCTQAVEQTLARDSDIDASAFYIRHVVLARSKVNATSLTTSQRHQRACSLAALAVSAYVIDSTPTVDRDNRTWRCHRDLVALNPLNVSADHASTRSRQEIVICTADKTKVSFDLYR